MLTYQDLLKCGNNEQLRKEFMMNAINEHKSSSKYKVAQNAEMYYKNVNPTITRYKKMLTKLTGERVEDIISANYKCASNFFRIFITQEVQYLLSNGVSFQKQETKGKIGGERFDNVLQELAKWAVVHGVSYGFFNLDHVEVLKMTEFVPLFDEFDGALKSGIRYWQIDDSKPLNVSLFELDGYTDYATGDKDKQLQIVNNKRPYKLKIARTIATEQIVAGENYNGFPIVAMYGNDVHQSELVGKQANIDAYDFVKSGMANEIDDTSLIYWTISNGGAMDDVDLATFIERIKTVGATTVESESQVQAHEVNLQISSKEQMLERLERDLYRDFMAVDTNLIANGAVTATQIRACYESLDKKTDGFEYQVLNFIDNLLALVGVEDSATFTRNKIVNESEMTSNILACADYLDDETILKHIPFISSEEIPFIMKRKQDEIMERYNDVDVDDEDGEEDGE